MRTNDGPVWRPLAERVSESGLPFLPFHATQFGLRMAREGSPFYLFPEHRDLVHWRAINDPRA